MIYYITYIYIHILHVLYTIYSKKHISANIFQQAEGHIRTVRYCQIISGFYRRFGTINCPTARKYAA